jgi:hypothetical protein
MTSVPSWILEELEISDSDASSYIRQYLSNSQTGQNPLHSPSQGVSGSRTQDDQWSDPWQAANMALVAPAQNFIPSSMDNDPSSQFMQAGSIFVDGADSRSHESCGKCSDGVSKDYFHSHSSPSTTANASITAEYTSVSSLTRSFGVSDNYGCSQLYPSFDSTSTLAVGDDTLTVTEATATDSCTIYWIPCHRHSSSTTIAAYDPRTGSMEPERLCRLFLAATNRSRWAK